MRFLVDIVDSVSGTIRFIIGGILLCGFAFSMLMTVGVSYFAPKIAEDYGERAERLGEKAIEAERERDRNRELAKDGWGYDGSASRQSHSRDRDADGGWGPQAR